MASALERTLANASPDISDVSVYPQLCKALASSAILLLSKGSSLSEAQVVAVTCNFTIASSVLLCKYFK